MHVCTCIDKEINMDFKKDLDHIQGITIFNCTQTSKKELTLKPIYSL